LVQQSHFAVKPSLGRVVFLPRGVQELRNRNPSRHPLFAFRLRSRFSTARLASWPQPSGSSHGLSSPTALADPRINRSRALPARFVPASGFGYPPAGFRPAEPCRFCFTPAALLGFALRRFLVQKGIRCVSTRMHPLTVPLSGVPAAEAPSRPDEPRFLGFVPFRSPSRSRGCLVH
jgi:hypothetical protein